MNIFVGTGLFGAAVKAISDIAKPADSNSTSVDADNQESNATITQGGDKSSSSQNSSFINPIWNPPTIEKEKYSNVQIPLRLEDEI